MTGNKNVDI